MPDPSLGKEAACQQHNDGTGHLFEKIYFMKYYEIG